MLAHMPLSVEPPRLDDPAIEAIGDFLAWFVNMSLNPRMSAILKTPSVAIPPDKVFFWRLTERHGHVKKLNPPALHVSWDGHSEDEPFTLTARMRRRRFTAAYVYADEPRRKHLELIAGLPSLVDHAFSEAAGAGMHADYRYKDQPALIDLGTATGLGFSWQYIGGAGADRWGIEERSRNDLLAEKKSVRDYPVFTGEFELMETISKTNYGQPRFPTATLTATIDHRDVEVMERQDPVPTA